LGLADGRAHRGPSGYRLDQLLHLLTKRKYGAAAAADKREKVSYEEDRILNAERERERERERETEKERERDSKRGMVGRRRRGKRRRRKRRRRREEVEGERIILFLMMNDAKRLSRSFGAF
jgi:hypothetical protein